MKPEDRQNKILAILRAMQQEIKVEDLAEMLEVSPLTIRRDLDQLSTQKTIIRTHGGCIAVGRAALETEYHQKVALNFELKQAIGVAAAKRIRSGETLLMNDGSTTFHLSSHLGGVGQLIVYTNSLAMISELSRFPDIRLILLGGEYRNESYSMRGSFTEQTLEPLHFDQVILGADAVSDEGSCTVSTPEEAHLTRIMLSRGTKKVLLADHTKAGRIGHVGYSTLDRFDLWITTVGIPEKMLQAYREMTEVVLVEP